MESVESSDELCPPPPGDDWVGLTSAPLPVGRATDWAVQPDCGAVVTFCGTARDHAELRPWSIVQVPQAQRAALGEVIAQSLRERDAQATQEQQA